MMETITTEFVNWLAQVVEGTNAEQKISEDKIDHMYAKAYLHYGNKNYLEASYLFRLLVVARPFDAKYWKGLAAALQMQHCYRDAINCYECSQTLLKDQADPYLDLHVADCHFSMKQVTAGLKALDAAQTIAKTKKNRAILQHVKLMREFWIK